MFHLGLLLLATHPQISCVGLACASSGIANHALTTRIVLKGSTAWNSDQTKAFVCIPTETSLTTERKKTVLTNNEWLHAGDIGGLGVSNIRHAMNINDVVSDTVHQFAPTYHSYVLYSNSGARNAPKTVRPKEVFVLPEAPNKFHDNANLLANMELGVHSDDAQMRTMSDQDEGSAKQHARDDALYRANTFSDVDEEFRTGPLEEDEVSPVHL